MGVCIVFNVISFILHLYVFSSLPNLWVLNSTIIITHFISQYPCTCLSIIIPTWSQIWLFKIVLFVLYCLIYNRLMLIFFFCSYIFVWYLLFESDYICLPREKLVFYLAQSLNTLCFISMMDNRVHFHEIQRAILLSSSAHFYHTIILLQTCYSLHSNFVRCTNVLLKYWLLKVFKSSCKIGHFLPSFESKSRDIKI